MLMRHSQRTQALRLLRVKQLSDQFKLKQGGLTVKRNLAKGLDNLKTYALESTQTS